MCEYGGGDECFFEFLERLLAVVGENPWDVFPGELHERDCDFRVAVNETVIEIGKPEEGHYISDFPGLRPVLDGLDFALGHREAVGGQLGFTTGIPRVHFSDTVPLPVNTVTVAGEGMTPYMFGYGVIPKKY